MHVEGPGGGRHRGEYFAEVDSLSVRLSKRSNLEVTIGFTYTWQRCVLGFGCLVRAPACPEVSASEPCWTGWAPSVDKPAGRLVDAQTLLAKLARL